MDKAPYWPFATQAEHDAYREMQTNGYAMLAKAHEAFMAAAARKP